MKELICNTIDFEPYDGQSVASAGTLGELKEIVDNLYFTYGGQASFSLEAEECWGSWRVSQSISTYHIETNDEYEKRILKENAKELQERAIREAQYLKLKVEFEGSSLAYTISRFKDSPPLPFSGFDPVKLMDKQ